MSAADQLLKLMNAISEDDYAAGWRIDLEYMLWRRVLSKRADEQTQVLRGLSSEAGGWWVFQDREDDGVRPGRTFMPLVEWVTLFNAEPRRGIDEDDDTLPATPAPSAPAGLLQRLRSMVARLRGAGGVALLLTEATDRIETLERQLAAAGEAVRRREAEVVALRERAGRVRLNLNDQILVRLTDAGRAKVLADEARIGLPPDLQGLHARADAEGWTRWALWDFAATLGPHLGMGREPPCEMEVRWNSKDGT